MLNNRPSDEFIDREKRIRVGMMTSDSAPTLSPADPAYWTQYAIDQQRERDAQMDEYRAIGAAVTNPRLALARCEQAQRDARATFDAMGRDGLATLDAEYADHSRQLGGQSAPVKDHAALDGEYLEFCRSFER